MQWNHLKKKIHLCNDQLKKQTVKPSGFIQLLFVAR